jgi:OFA family oxalate/formate antiporter-like MFS transporter
MTKREFKMSNEKVMNRWLVVFGAVLVQMCLGAIYAWSVFTPVLIDAGWSTTQTMIAFSAALVSYAVVMVWAGFQLEKLGPRFLAICGGLVLGAGYIIAGLFGGTSFWMIFLFIGIMGGAGIGIGYVVPISVGMKWFPDKKGMITGLAVAGFGFGATGWVKIAGSVGKLIENYGLSNTFVIFGVAFAVLVTIGGFFMVNPPEGWLPEGYEPEDASNGAAAANGADFSGTEILSKPQYYMMFITFIFSAGAGLMTIGLIKPFGIFALKGTGMAVAQASASAGTALAILSIANGLGRIAWGTISDKTGAKVAIIIMVSAQAVMLVLFNFMAGTEKLFYIAAALIGFNFGGNFALFPTITAEVFGTANVGKNYPLVFLAYGFGGTLCPIVGGMFGDKGMYSTAFTISAALCVVGVILIAMIKKPEADSAVIEGAEASA